VARARVALPRATGLHRKVALKRLASRTPQSGGEDPRPQMLLEARAAARISHPNIAAVHDVLDQSPGPFIVMEYVDGESLERRLHRGPLPVETVVHLGRQLAAGLAAAHAEGVIHRD